MNKQSSLLASGILILALLIPYWKLTFMQGFVITDDIFASDIMNEGFPYRYAISETLKSGHLPLWVPHIYGGFPLLARGEAGVCYPFNLILFGLLPPYIALNIIILLTLVTASLGMYLYVREIDGSFSAGIAGGIAFAFSGYMVSHIKHLSNVNAACWLPLGLFFIERTMRRNDPRQLIGLALVFGLQHLSGHTQVAYYSGLFYIVYFVFRYLKHRRNSAEPERTKKKRRWDVQLPLAFIGALFFGSVFGAVQLLPTYELVSLSQRSGGVTFDYAANYAYDPNNVLTFIYPYIHGDIGAGTYRGKSIFWEDYGYVGIIVFAFALYAAVRLWKNWYVKMFSIATVVSYILVLGPNTPVYEAVFHAVPGMQYFRFPTRFLLITDVSLIVLAAIGLTRLSRRYEEKRKTTSALFSRFELVVLALVIIDLWYFQLRQNPIVDGGQWLTPPQTAQFLWQKEGLTPKEWGMGDNLFRIYVVGGIESHKRAFALARGWEGDLQPYISQREFLQPSSNVLYGFSTPDGYANLTPNYLVEVWGDQNRSGMVYQTAGVRENRFVPTPAFWNIMNVYNVRYILSFWPLWATANEARFLRRIGQVAVYENSNSLPRAYLVGKVRAVRDPDEAKRVMVSRDFKPEKEVILYKQVYPESRDTLFEKVKVVSYTPNNVEMRVRAPVEAILVFSDSYYPGWEAEIDGERRGVLQANITQRAVIVPAGDHVVRFVFRSKPVAWGFWITVGGSVIFAGIFVIVKRTIRRREHYRRDSLTDGAS